MIKDHYLFQFYFQYHMKLKTMRFLNQNQNTKTLIKFTEEKGLLIQCNSQSKLKVLMEEFSKVIINSVIRKYMKKRKKLGLLQWKMVFLIFKTQSNLKYKLQLKKILMKHSKMNRNKFLNILKLCLFM